MSAKTLSNIQKIYPFFIFVSFIVVFFGWYYTSKTKSATKIKSLPNIENYDIRTDKESQKKIENFIAESGQTIPGLSSIQKISRHSIEKLRQQIPALKIEYNDDLKIPEIMAVENKAKIQNLTDKNNLTRNEILRNFLKQNSALFGLDELQINQLKTTADYTNPNGSLSFVHLEQKINEIPVFRGEVKAGFTKHGEIIRIINNLAPNLEYENLNIDFGRPEFALQNAVKHLNLMVNQNDLKIIENESDELKTTYERGQFEDKTIAEKMYFPITNGVARTAWRVLLWTKTEAFYVIVDAQDGTLLWRKSITENQTQTATYNVYGNLTSPMKTADSPSPFTPGCTNPNNCPQPPIINRMDFTLIGNEPPYNFNNLGWIPDGENRTVGNNAEAGIDRQSPNGIDSDGWAFGNPNRVFSYTYNPAPGNPSPGEEPLPTTQTYPPSQFQQGTITHAFYTANRWHDEMYLLGFTEQAGNFQNDNFGRGGISNDRLLIEVQEFTGTNGANFAAPADGGQGRLQLFIWANPTPERDGGLDSQIAVHELTHGLSNRLHGNATGLGSNMARGMGEGWSDFYSLALLSEPSDNLCGTYAEGSYSVFEIIPEYANYYYGIRRFPTARIECLGPNSNPHNPLTFGNINAGNCTNFASAYPRGPIGVNTCDQVHNIGEIWNAALWEVRGFLIQQHGAVEGNRRALQYVTDGMKLSPLNPNMLQGRDAIIAAANASNPSDAQWIRRGFALRGMGTSAQIISASPANVVEAFDFPANLSLNAIADFDGDSKSDISVFRPSEGNWYLNQSTNGFGVINWGISTDKLTPADFDGDGKTDAAIFRPSADPTQADFYILNSSNFTFVGFSWGLPDDIPVIEDFDGDGKADATIFRPSQNLFYAIASSSGNALVSRPMPAGTPMAKDFDGDGKGDFATFSNGQWFISKSSTNHTSGETFNWGLSTDKLVSADYDGDGQTDLAVYRPSDGVWYIQKSSGGISYIQWGISTDIPSPGDFDGDGKTDVAVYRDGIWYINQSTSGILITQFGLANDIPIESRYFD